MKLFGRLKAWRLDRRLRRLERRADRLSALLARFSALLAVAGMAAEEASIAFGAVSRALESVSALRDAHGRSVLELGGAAISPRELELSAAFRREMAREEIRRPGVTERTRAALAQGGGRVVLASPTYEQACNMLGVRRVEVGHVTTRSEDPEADAKATRTRDYVPEWAEPLAPASRTVPAVEAGPPPPPMPF